MNEQITNEDVKQLLKMIDQLVANQIAITETQQIILSRLCKAIPSQPKNIEYRLMANYIGTEAERRALLTEMSLVMTHKLQLVDRMLNDSESRLLKHEYNKTLCTLEKLKYKLELWKKAHEKYIVTTEHADNKKASDEEAKDGIQTRQ